MSVDRCLRHSARTAQRVVAVVLAVALLAACGGDGSRGSTPEGKTSPSTHRGFGEMTVFAAASLTDAFGEIASGFEARYAGTHVNLSFAGSSQLRAQILEGAPADVFASADQQNMDQVVAAGRISGNPQVFARNRLVVIVPAANPAGITTLEDLARPGVKLVLAQPDVPVGFYAREALAKMDGTEPFGAGFAERVLANVVSEETNVRQVVTKVQLGEADAGIVYVSDVTPGVQDQVATIAIPDAFNVIAAYPIAAVSGAPNPAGAAAFVSYVLSVEGQAVLARHGFLPGSSADLVPSGIALTFGASERNLLPGGEGWR